MRFVMNPDAAYQYPIWWVGLFIAIMGIVLTVLVELAARWIVPVEFRRRHNDVAAAMLSIIGVTYAVLLAFVAMLAWDGYNRAKATSYAEAGLVRDVANVAAGFPEPAQSALRDEITGYARAVITLEWPAQAEGRHSDRAIGYLDAMDRMGMGFRPSTATEGTLQSQVLQALMRLQDARQERIAAADSALPVIVWVVLLLGGGLTIAFASFLGAPSLVMHLAMASVLAISGALVLVLIVALSNPFRGDFRVSAEPFERVLVQVAAPRTP